MAHQWPLLQNHQWVTVMCGKVLVPIMQKMIDDAVGGLRADVDKLHSELQDRDKRYHKSRKKMMNSRIVLRPWKVIAMLTT